MCGSCFRSKYTFYCDFRRNRKTKKEGTSLFCKQFSPQYSLVNVTKHQLDGSIDNSGTTIHICMNIRWEGEGKGGHEYTYRKACEECFQLTGQRGKDYICYPI